MKKFESIHNLEKFRKTELKKIKGGLRATGTLRSTSTPVLKAYESFADALTSDSDSDSDGV